MGSRFRQRLARSSQLSRLIFRRRRPRAKPAVPWQRTEDSSSSYGSHIMDPKQAFKAVMNVFSSDFPRCEKLRTTQRCLRATGPSAGKLFRRGSDKTSPPRFDSPSLSARPEPAGKDVRPRRWLETESKNVLAFRRPISQPTPNGGRRYRQKA